jgi:hypothetical protein
MSLKDSLIRIIVRSDFKASVIYPTNIILFGNLRLNVITELSLDARDNFVELHSAS